MESVTLADLGYEGGKKVARAPVESVTSKASTGVTSSIEDRALALLGSGVSPEATASALGVTPSRISQLISNTEFSNQLATMRYENLQKHNLRDSKYDELEDTLINKLESALPLMIRPHEILKAITTINGAKRRGQSSPDQTINQQNIVNLVLPDVIAQKFTVNVNNQVTRAGEQELHTMPASNLLNKIEQLDEQHRLSQMSAPDEKEITQTAR